ncbi:IS481 family transposase [Agrococcus baldri]|uniref:IS481 family transposase n=1 Tax=Agrococcus baldri TaxID=153730 RepID=A0AA87UT56_9MICO|nr:IS481 family transposase [Agrococcus baldri]GEK81691.1 IS481 family transposase [Agrococcus baldri]
MSHANARLTPRGRRLIIDRYLAGWKQAHIAAAMGCSRRCVARWIDRWRVEGDAGLVDRSSRPCNSPNRTSDAVEERVLELRQQKRLGRDRIAELVPVAARTVSRILARRGSPPLRLLDPMTGALIRSSKQTAIRYERSRPGELVHMDVKKLGRIPDGGGWRVNGKADSRSAAQKRTPKGYDFIHSLVDDHSRLAYSEILGDEKGPTCAGFLHRAAAFFAKHGISRIERLMTDNAWAYRYSLRDACQQLGTKQVFIRPHCPWQNGKVERYNRTLQAEWAYRQPFASNSDRAAALAPWLQRYNTERIHSAIGAPPISRLQPTC